MSSLTPTVDQLKRAIVIAEQIKKLEAELSQILGQPGAPAPARRGRPSKASLEAAAAPEPAVKKRKKMSAEGRAAIVAAQKARWAKQKKAAAANGNGDKSKK